MITIEMINEAEEIETLKEVLNHHPKPYIRERAAAILKIAAGQSGLQVAKNGLLKRRKADTVYGWVHAYNAKGLPGLYIAPGRGRLPKYNRQKEQEVKKKVRLIVQHHRDPNDFHR